MIATPATVENMRKAAEQRPAHRVIAWSPYTGEESSANPGDYWKHSDTEPLTDSEGNPMVLIYKRTLYLDALTGEEVLDD